MGGQKDMNAQKYTQKSLEAVRLAQDLALEQGNMQIEQPHLDRKSVV